MSVYKISKYLFFKARKLLRNESYTQLDQYLIDYKKRFGDILGIPSQESSEKILLIYSNHNIAYCMNIEAIIAKKIQMEYGWKVVFLCTLSTIDLAKKICGDIYEFKHFDLIENYMPIWVSNTNAIKTTINQTINLKEIEDLRYNNIPIGIHALATYSGTLPTANVELNRESRKKIWRFVTNSARYCIASKKILDKYSPNLVLSIEKGNVGTCELFYESINQNVAFIQYLGCHEPESIMIKRYNQNNLRMHPFSISDKSWEEISYEDKMSKIVLNAFKIGYQKGDWFKYKNLSSDKKMIQKDELSKLLGLNPNKKNVIIFSHILNDANFFYGKDLFEGGFREWFVRTVEVASQNDQVNWLIKLHPANIFRRTNQGYTGEYGEILAIKEYLGEIPSNIKIIPADIDINPYSFFMLADYGITVRGTVGAELPCFGIPVLTAGTGRYSGKGFTVDSDSIDDYLYKVKNIHLISSLDIEEIKLAIKHAYLFFKERPASYKTFLSDIYPKEVGRDIEIIDEKLWQNNILKNICDFFVVSNEEDFLTSKQFGV